MLTGGILLPGSTVRYKYAGRPTAPASDIPMVNPTVMNLLPASVDYVTNALG